MFDFLFPRRALQIADVAAWDVAPNNLQTMVLDDIFGEETADRLPIQRDEALTVPAVQGVQNFITATLGGMQLVADRDGAPLAQQPGFLTRTGQPTQSCYLRNVRTFLDFAFLGFSLWGRDSGSDTYPLHAWHIPFGRWSFDDNGRILIDSEPVNADDVIFFESMVPGLLNYSNRTLRGAIEVERTVEKRAKVSLPVVMLEDTSDWQPTEDELAEIIQSYVDARKAKNGAVAYVNRLHPTTVDEPAGAWLLEARNAFIADIAKATLIPSALLEGTSSVDSLTYATELGQLARFVTVSSRLYTDPIESRLSMPDVTPNGQSITFDRAPLEAVLTAAQTNSKETSSNG